MHKPQPLSLQAFVKTQDYLNLLGSREHLGFQELTSLLRLPLRQGQKHGSCLGHGLSLLYPYAFWRLGLRSRRAAMPYYFQVNLAKLQPFYTTLAGTRKAHKTFSAGCILRLYRITTKRDRRKVEKAPFSLRFFRRFFRRYFRRAQTTAVCLGYRRRYAFFLATAFIPFVKRYARSLVFAPQALTGAFSFRRIKAIKKRIRKRLGTGPKAR